MEDWAAVADAINKRVDELGWPQGELAQRSHVSRATVREVQHHTAERRRSARTLEALSIALGWHPRHIDAVLGGYVPPDPPENTDSVHSRLDVLESRLVEISGQLGDVKSALNKLVERVSKND